ncbi:XrtA/PEP-CTERM system amidotransferase [Sphingomonas sp. SUN039]|uniref:XrtA/PEP-CTERM system amidotransferase n=1 Tax=Sphingomonas sp. SUN039 TaxID=2937787 RepID=UPI0021645CED|nr:XrtA/PEP-CTERM system amidotransferase [Sphingomonas sp. SUN039]UVO53301.1 amidotransferase 1, exosortase A system-associated [Sphingomonas sp. SUN039]
MCGIAGLFHLGTPKPVDPARVVLMTDALAHRGPDGSGVWTAQGVGLGHRRLSIIDLGGGAQPMLSADEQVVVVFNGEIYNFADVRRELQATGAQFRTDSDTEVLIHGWRVWGPDLLPRLNGMFAFALFDVARQMLFLARDRLGVKPLHYVALADGSIAFASELKGLLANPAVRRELNPQAIEDFFAFGYVPDDTCWIEGVQKLPAASFLLLERGKPLPAPRVWWDVDFTQRAKGTVADLEAEMRDRLRAAVTSRMVADVPLGAFLSGGVDSSSVVAFMAEASSHPVQTCAIGFDSAAHDETRYAAEIAKRFACDHRSRIVASDDYAAADTVARMFDEPFADASALATWRVSQLARETVTVALSGDGADEIFAGYRRYKFQHTEERVRSIVPQGWREPVFGSLARAYPKADWAPQMFRAKSTFAALALGGGEAYARAVGVTPFEERAGLFSDSFKRSLQGHRAEDRYVAAMQNAPARDPLDRAQYADLKIWLPGDILTKVDRTSMAVSLEAREPLLDHRLVEFAATLPVSMRLRGGEGKWLMKRTMRGTLPDDILYRRKMGFVTPVSAWFRGPLAGEARRLAGLADTGWFERTTLERVAEDHIAGKRDHGRLLWQLAMFEKALALL